MTTNPYTGSAGGHPHFSPTASGLTQGFPRRPSYATVASDSRGDGAGLLGRAPGAFASTAQQLRGEQQPQALMAGRDRAVSRGGGGGNMDVDVQGRGEGVTGRTRTWSRDRLGCPVHDDHPPFFTPSYLRHSRHVQRLQRLHDDHVAELQEQARLNPPQPPPLSTKSSHASLKSTRSMHTHRAPVQDVIERLPPPTEEDRSHPLPSRWNEDDRMNGLEILADGTEVRFGGVTKTSDEAASIRADHPMPKECGIYYFEVTMLSKGKEGLIGIGFSTKKAGLNRLPGWEGESWAYHGDDGYSFACTASGKAYGPRYSSQDVIGCGVNFRTGNCFFTKNGIYLGVAFTNISKGGLYPSVGMKKPGEHLRINFGRTPFVFDIDGMMERERESVFSDINQTNTEDEGPLINKLVGQYLAHEGYVETAKAFAKDVREQQQSLGSNTTSYEAPNSEDDIHAINRQKIRKSVLDGDIDRALKYTSSYYPHVLEEERNRDIYFRLKCRKFIEMMRRYAELAGAASSPVMAKSMESLSSNGHADSAQPSGQDQPDTQMELDDQIQRETSRDQHPQSSSDDIDMDASQELPIKAKAMKRDELIPAALSYGQELQQEFGNDPRPHVKKQLQDLFAIIAYQNPADSPISGLLDQRCRAEIAEEVNGAILVSLGKPSSAALEKLCAVTDVMLDDTAAKSGGASALVNVKKDFLRP
ncbi:SPRY-domain-containing protein [Hortaea werneckii]|nr:SPRY-domain-containing protein [Hortaea werneckii]KAI7101933.1 SPRY-domain-containing protein [Hortaea werneckii]KAI7227262.1 SPRY-domain-containing protein [Hortaea werneckii]KAI7330377.1 SPRY-domain-containing protein [Hortaea werneckii]KAI7392196.1 SPRY-domain-containing protein [Hortaea werneckii]